MGNDQDGPRILFIEDVALIFRCSTSTIKRRLRAKTFPVDPLSPVDKKRRWSAASVYRYIDDFNSRRGRT